MGCHPRLAVIVVAVAGVCIGITLTRPAFINHRHLDRPLRALLSLGTLTLTFEATGRVI